MKIGVFKLKFSGNVNVCARCWSSAVGGLKEVEKPTQRKENHAFNDLPYTNLKELSEHLQKNIVFNDKKLIVLNKPAGLGKETPRVKQKPVEIRMTPSYQKIDHITFSDVLPYLSKDLNLPDLQLIKVPERFASGISVLCTNSQMKKRIEKALGDLNKPVYTYLAICDGIPLILNRDIKLGATLVEKSGIKKTVFVKNYSRRSVMHQKVMPLIFNHDTLCVNEKLNVSLVRITNNRNKWSALRAFCAQQLLSPILGDYIYGSCVQILDEKAMPVSPFSPVANFPPKLSANILSTLQLTKRDQSIIPLHLHLAQFDFAKFKEHGTAFIAKPPDHFLWTCEKFDLTVPELYLQNTDTPLDSLVVNKQCTEESCE